MYNGIYNTDASLIPYISYTDKCVVLDLDQTLIATQDNEHSLRQLGIMTNPKLLRLRERTYYITLENIDKPGSGSKSSYWGVTRPYVKEFLIFCFSYFKIVAVWSAGKRAYVEAIVDYLFQDIRPPHIIFTHDDIPRTKHKKDSVEKPLSKMINHDTFTKRYMMIENTLAIDDNPDTCVNNEANTVLIPEYSPDATIEGLMADDHTLLQLKYWLLQPEIMYAPDVRVTDKNEIFEIPVMSYIDRLLEIEQIEELRRAEELERQQRLEKARNKSRFFNW